MNDRNVLFSDYSRCRLKLDSKKFAYVGALRYLGLCKRGIYWFSFPPDIRGPKGGGVVSHFDLFSFRHTPGVTGVGGGKVPSWDPGFLAGKKKDLEAPFIQGLEVSQTPVYILSNSRSGVGNLLAVCALSIP